jgi:hypothetical protein
MWLPPGIGTGMTPSKAPAVPATASPIAISNAARMVRRA